MTKIVKRGGYRGGSRKGVPNKATTNAREAIARFVDANVPRLEEWLEQIAANEGPLAAFRCVQEVMEYHIPKLARTELTGEGGGPVSTVVKHVYEDTAPKPPTREE